MRFLAKVGLISKASYGKIEGFNYKIPSSCYVFLLLILFFVSHSQLISRVITRLSLIVGHANAARRRLLLVTIEIHSKLLYLTGPYRDRRVGLFVALVEGAIYDGEEGTRLLYG